MTFSESFKWWQGPWGKDHNHRLDAFLMFIAQMPRVAADFFRIYSFFHKACKAKSRFIVS